MIRGLEPLCCESWGCSAWRREGSGENLEQTASTCSLCWKNTCSISGTTNVGGVFQKK